MNALVVTDLHAHTAWPFSKPLSNGRPSRFQDLLDVLDQVRGYVEQYKPDDLLILGDLTHRRHFISFSLYNDLMSAIYDLTVRVKQTTILVGNHDLESGAVHSLYPFSFLPNTIVIDRPRVVTLSDGVDAVYAVPYLDDPLAVSAAFQDAPSELPVLAHYAAEGVQLETDYWLESPLKIGELARFPLVLFGHVHKPSEQLDGQVVYVGAPMHFDFGDHGPRRALLVKNGTWIPLPLTAPVFETARWPRLPRAEGQPGYLRIMDVPRGQLEEAKAYAVNLGWLDSVAYEAALPVEVRAALEQGLVVDEGLLRDYVRRRCPTMGQEDQEALVHDGIAYLQEARG